MSKAVRLADFLRPQFGRRQHFRPAIILSNFLYQLESLKIISNTTRIKAKYVPTHLLENVILEQKMNDTLNIFLYVLMEIRLISEDTCIAAKNIDTKLISSKF